MPFQIHEESHYYDRNRTEYVIRVSWDLMKLAERATIEDCVRELEKSGPFVIKLFHCKQQEVQRLESNYKEMLLAFQQAIRHKHMYELIVNRSLDRSFYEI